MSNLRSRSAAAALAAAGTLMFTVLAAAPEAGAQPVYVCQKVGGTFHVVSKKQKCQKNESKLSLMAGTTNVVGATGPTGPQGPQGAQGAQGVSGATGPQGSGSASSQATGAEGVKGATGPTGATGATGATGPTGATGLTGANAVGAIKEETATNTAAVPAGEKVAIQATCPSGDVVIGGGFKPVSSEVVAITSAPDAAGTGWEYSALNQDTVEQKAGELTVYVFCATVK
jgi:hypothetical protein